MEVPFLLVRLRTWHFPIFSIVQLLLSLQVWETLAALAVAGVECFPLLFVEFRPKIQEALAWALQHSSHNRCRQSILASARQQIASLPVAA